jgi:hypothetical protein
MTKDPAVQIAEVVSNGMNLGALLDNTDALEAMPRDELRAALLSLADDLERLGSELGRGHVAGLAWPLDANERIACLRSAASAWDPALPVPGEVVVAARGCVAIINQPGTAP